MKILFQNMGMSEMAELWESIHSGHRDLTSPRYFCTNSDPTTWMKASSCMMSNSLGKHGFASSWRSIQQNSSGGVNTNLLVELMVCERQLHCFTNLLLLNVIASNILFPSHIQQFENYGWYYNDRPRCWRKASIYQKYPKQTILLTLASHADLALSHPLQVLWS